MVLENEFEFRNRTWQNPYKTYPYRTEQDLFGPCRDCTGPLMYPYWTHTNLYWTRTNPYCITYYYCIWILAIPLRTAFVPDPYRTDPYHTIGEPSCTNPYHTDPHHTVPDLYRLKGACTVMPMDLNAQYRTLAGPDLLDLYWPFLFRTDQSVSNRAPTELYLPYWVKTWFNKKNVT